MIDALLVSADKGIVLFDLIEGNELSDDYTSRQDDSANKLEARLKPHSELMDRRKLLIPINVISFAPGTSNLSPYSKDDYPLTNSASLVKALDELMWDDAEGQIYEKALSAIQSISTIRQSRVRRTVKKEDSRGSKLKELEDSIATLDRMQSKAVIETVEGVQRIRGLAGSGKTIVLALKAAYLHAQHPEWRIAVTFNTRSLKGQFHRYINSFCIEQTGEEPAWDNLRILNGWGAPGGPERDGIYYEFCRAHDVEYLDFRTARQRFGQEDPFSAICEQAIAQVSESRRLYDAILIDEAQDFSPAFLKLCYEFLKDPQRLVYAYDELQNLSRESLPPPESIFGESSEGVPLVRFVEGSDDRPQQDIILEKCYRNSRPVLTTAHALGFGIYREPPDNTGAGTGLIQMFENPELWTEVGYQIKGGELSDGRQVTLERTWETSPIFLEEHSNIEDLVKFIPFNDATEQTEWIVRAIQENLENDELRHDDIIVINPNPLTTRRNVGPLRSRLFQMGINSHLAGVDTDADTFFQADTESVTFTGVFRAKGNEAGMVYIINAQDCNSSSAPNLARIRNQLFTAITRSKAWVRVLGFGHGMKELMKEYEKLKEQNFELRFTYPDAEQRNHLRIVHRDTTPEERKHIQGRQRSLWELVADLQSGKLKREDLDESAVESLRDLLG